MHIEQFRDYCLTKHLSTESMPFDDDILVFKVNGKIFALISTNNSDSCNLKCDPEKAIELREQYSGIKPGFHQNKKHWNTVSFNEDVSDKLILDLVDHSYKMVIQNFSKKIQKSLFGDVY